MLSNKFCSPMMLKYDSYVGQQIVEGIIGSRRDFNIEVNY